MSNEGFDPTMPLTADEALARLADGNRAYCAASANAGEIGAELRRSLVEGGQHPYAVVLACSDSRVVPEHIFMTGLGELFTIRVAGNVVDTTQAASVAYAVSHLGARLVLVLGHTHCGAVGAVLGGGTYGCVTAVTNLIQSAIGEEHDEDAACLRNVAAGVDRLRREPEIALLMKHEGLRVEGALYHTGTGEVEWL